jgi:ABC-2 type transport system permease protein
LLSNVFVKSLRDELWPMVWWASGIGLLSAMIIAFFPSIRGNDDFNAMLESYPDNLMALFGLTKLTDITSAVGFLNAELFGLMAPLLFVIHGVVLGSGAIAGEEGRGTLEILLTEPISRRKLVAQKFAAMITNAIFLGLVLWIVLVISALAIDMGVSVLRLAAITFSTVLLGVTFGALAFAAGCITGSRSNSVFIVAAVAVGTYLLNAASGIVSYMQWAKWMSPFFYYNAADPLANGLNPTHAAVLLATIAILLGAGYAGLQRRDLRL